MKTVYHLFCTIVLCATISNTYAQQSLSMAAVNDPYKYWALKVPMANMIDFYSAPNLQVGLERRFNMHQGLQFIAGISIDPNESHVVANGFRLKSEYRQYFHIRKKYSYYMAGELFYTQYRNTFYQEYMRPDSTVYEDHVTAFTRKYGVDIKWGIHRTAGKHFMFDAYAGLGLQQVTVTQTGRSFPEDPIYDYPAVDFHISNKDATAAQKNIQVTMPINFAIGYIF